MNHDKGCNCSACNTISRKPLISQNKKTSLAKNVSLTIESNDSTNSSSSVIQRIQCDITRNGTVVGRSPQIGMGGRGGVSHAEQRAWNAAGPPAIADGDIIKFVVDGPICEGCTAWFENTLYPVVHAAGGILMVNVLYNEPNGNQYYGTIQVTGPGTVWGKVSEAGYYGHGGLDGDREVVRALGQAFK